MKTEIHLIWRIFVPYQNKPNEIPAKIILVMGMGYAYALPDKVKKFRQYNFELFTVLLYKSLTSILPYNNPLVWNVENA